MKLEEIPASSEAEYVRVETESGIKVRRMHHSK
jgi:hypothetical protein